LFDIAYKLAGTAAMNTVEFDTSNVVLIPLVFVRSSLVQ
jgi:hypothetical protein